MLQIAHGALDPLELLISCLRSAFSSICWLRGRGGGWRIYRMYGPWLEDLTIVGHARSFVSTAPSMLVHRIRSDDANEGFIPTSARNRARTTSRGQTDPVEPQLAAIHPGQLWLFEEPLGAYIMTY